MKHLSLKCGKTYLGSMHTRTGKVLGGQFYWGGTLPKSNAGVQRLANCGWKSQYQHKGLSQLDCESDGSSRDESRS